MSRPIFLLVDGHALIYRAFYALPPLTDPQGRVVNAVYGFSRVLLSALDDFEPEYTAVAFDLPGPTLRHEEFEDYKAHRPEMPDDLKPQIPLVKQVVEALNIPQFSLEGYEADDLIGTVSYQLDHCPQELGAPEDLLTVIVTGDKDMFQLVDDNTHVWIPGRGKRGDTEYDYATVQKKMGVRPDQIVDLKALMGDASDNIPGIKGIGIKTAVKLLQNFDNLDKLYQSVERVQAGQADAQEKNILKGALLKKLARGRDKAFLSQKLAQIDQQVSVEIDLDHCRVDSYDKTKAVELFQALEFRSLISMLPNDQFEADVQSALF
ncbi:MAG: hypothetical protein GF381_03825 [Candidatus Pacebacteria bacterium]|nr:hypothetical protein [Candidatus Paceibacterota bacterium]